MKTSLQQTTRTSQRTILNYTLAGVAVALLVDTFFFFNVGMSKTSYAATENESLLPIELISFTANMTSENKVVIRWSTAAEKGNDFFTIERSLDGQNFFVLDTVQGAGDSNKRIEYTYTDPLPVSGYNYYRLKQSDFDGKFEYFNVVAVINDKAESQLSQIHVSPNPFFDEFEVNFHATDNSMVHVKLMDMQGRTIINKSLEAEKGTNSFIYNNDLLQSGIYLFTIVQKGMPAQTFRLVKSSH